MCTWVCLWVCTLVNRCVCTLVNTCVCTLLKICVCPLEPTPFTTDVNTWKHLCKYLRAVSLRGSPGHSGCSRADSANTRAPGALQWPPLGRVGEAQALEDRIMGQVGAWALGCLCLVKNAYGELLFLEFTVS